MKNQTIFVQVVKRPRRKLILKRGIKATHYFEYCDEVGCDVWDILTNVKGALYEPIGLWLPENLRTPETSEYVQGVEVPQDYQAEVPEGFEVIELSECKMMVFQGPKFKDEEFAEAIKDVRNAIDSFDPQFYGFNWLTTEPRFQIQPLGERGYVEALPVEQVN